MNPRENLTDTDIVWVGVFVVVVAVAAFIGLGVLIGGMTWGR